MGNYLINKNFEQKRECKNERKENAKIKGKKNAKMKGRKIERQKKYRRIDKWKINR